MGIGKILITPYYKTGNDERDFEIDSVLKKNISSGLFEKIILFCDNNVRPNFHYELIEFVDFNERPTYLDFFNKGNEYTDKIIVVSNSDIFFDDTLFYTESFLIEKKELLALTRYEYLKNYEEVIIEMIMGCDSQDSWIYLSPINTDNMNIDFGLGIPGCDNRIAYELSKNYIVRNPSYSIKTYHFHESNYRNYNPHNRLSGDYLQVHME